MEATTVMATATNELIYQVSAMVISTVVTVLGVYLKRLIKTNSYVKECDLYNKKVENVLNNAINYAEASAKKYASDKISKKDYALKYIEEVSPDIIHKEGVKLELMLDRKVEQVLKK